MKEIFTKIYEENLWCSPESKSGPGSSLDSTEVLRKELPVLFKKFDITSILDIPCGDFNWMRHVDFNEIKYTGADIVEPLIESNKERFPEHDFKVLDLVNDPLPAVDLIFVRDCLGHLSNRNVLQAIANMRKSGSKYLLATSFTVWSQNPDIVDGGWKCINLMIEPFNLVPFYLINEECKEGYPFYTNKCMILFKL